MYGALYLSIPHWKTCVNCPGEGYYGKAHEVLEFGQTGVYILALIYSHHCLHFALTSGHWCVCQRTLGDMNGQT